MEAADRDFDELFLAEHASIVRAAFLVTGDRATADEVAQDAFVELLGHWDRVRHLDRPGAWVRRVAIRRAVKVAGRDTRRRHLERVERRTVESETEGMHVDTMRALAQLSPAQRAAVVLRYFCDLPVAEVADHLGCREATAGVHLHRARTRLAELLADPEAASVDGRARGATLDIPETETEPEPATEVRPHG